MKISVKEEEREIIFYFLNLTVSYCQFLTQQGVQLKYVMELMANPIIFKY